MTEPEEINGEIKETMDLVGQLMKEITHLIASLEDNPNEKNDELDKKINQLILHLKVLKNFYSHTPLKKPGDEFPSTSDNFENFVKKILFNSPDDKLVEFISDNHDEDKIWKLNLMNLVHGVINERNYVSVRDFKTKKLFFFNR